MSLLHIISTLFIQFSVAPESALEGIYYFFIMYELLIESTLKRSD